MNYKQKLILRHKNPIGLVLRVVSYFMIGVGLWNHELALIILFLLIDGLNWIFMPMVKPENESRIVNTIVKKELAWIRNPLSFSKIITVITGLILLLLITIGLWYHNWLVLSAAFICITLLKQLLLKSAVSYPNNQTQKKSINHQKIQK